MIKHVECLGEIIVPELYVSSGGFNFVHYSLPEEGEVCCCASERSEAMLALGEQFVSLEVAHELTIYDALPDLPNMIAHAERSVVHHVTFLPFFIEHFYSGGAKTFWDVAALGYVII